jgi:hypothetical protein
LAEAEAAAAEVAAMPAGTHEVLDQTRSAVERRATALLARLHEFADEPAAESVDAEDAGADEMLRATAG